MKSAEEGLISGKDSLSKVRFRFVSHGPTCSAITSTSPASTRLAVLQLRLGHIMQGCGYFLDSGVLRHDQDNSFNSLVPGASDTKAIRVMPGATWVVLSIN